ncbi:response regulator [Haliangium ochraceum]|uniref:Response regulator receiver protein n=1 Tax=Haliangium ochraceum (strain DSM 14365 / JCM 11303 / SMP-2) TaxID=502025 RepID=D0LIG5_HALO1|nr:response regulator [Haliangium ochraceum]ACY18321.1 response regulator receiver protein [Haliangium ochraceum DSM 14365]
MSASETPPSARPSRIERLLIVEDNERLRSMLARVLGDRASDIRSAGSVAEVEALLGSWHPDAAVLDFSLPDGDGLQVLDAIAAAGPMPAVVAISGEVQPGDSFRLAQRGVRAFVPKPLDPERLQRALDTALATPPDVVPIVRAAVGHVGVREVEETVREAMVSEALARSSGSRNAAARLLAVSRQFLQHVLKKNR